MFQNLLNGGQASTDTNGNLLANANEFFNNYKDGIPVRVSLNPDTIFAIFAVVMISAIAIKIMMK